MAKKQHDNEQRKEELQTNEELQDMEQMDGEQEKQRFFRRFKETLEEYAGGAYRIRYIENRGINHIPYKSVALHKEGKGGDWNFHLDSLYENFKKGVPIKNLILHMILKTELTNTEDVVPDNITSRFSDYESIKEYLTVHLMNMEKNRDFLKGKISVPFLDLAAGINFVLKYGEDEMGSMPIPEWMFDGWGVSELQMLNDAISNTVKRFPPQVIPVAEMLDSVAASLSGEAKDRFETYMNKPKTEEETKAENFFIITNKYGFRGASVILYPHFLETLTKETGAEKIILFPSSLHEMFAIPYDEHISVEKCRAIIHDVNREAVMPEEYLGDNAYIYDLQSDTVTIWGEENAEQKVKSSESGKR